MAKFSGIGIDIDGRLDDYNEATSFCRDDLDAIILQIPDFDKVCEAALKEAAPIMEKAMKKACKETILHEGESEMVDSIKAKIPKKTNTDAWIVSVEPTGNSGKVGFYFTKNRRSGYRRRYKISNALKAIWKEYGIPGHQPARPFLTAATNAAKKAVELKIQEVYDRMVGK